MNKDVKLIQDMIAAEGKMEGDQMVVPADFFDRLNAALNPPQRSVLDMLLDALDKPERR